MGLLYNLILGPPLLGMRISFELWLTWRKLKLRLILPRLQEMRHFMAVCIAFPGGWIRWLFSTFSGFETVFFWENSQVSWWGFFHCSIVPLSQPSNTSRNRLLKLLLLLLRFRNGQLDRDELFGLCLALHQKLGVKLPDDVSVGLQLAFLGWLFWDLPKLGSPGSYSDIGNE